MKERKVHINLEEAAVAATSGVVVGIAAAGAVTEKSTLIEAAKISASIAPFTLMYAYKVKSRVKEEKSGVIFKKTKEGNKK